MISRIAHAKINLALHVTGKNDKGYHLLDSIVGFTEFGDRISVSKADEGHGFTLEINGPFGKGLSIGPDNLVLKAAHLYADAHYKAEQACFPVNIQLEKNLPIASGIGGGSADAAATLLALQEIWKSHIDPMEIADQLGADVPMCLHSKPLRAQGIGEVITPLNGVQAMHIVLVNPNVEVSTPQVFNALVNKNNPAIIESAIKEMRNDLEAPAIEIAPIIFDVLDMLEKQNPLFARMSGSGATCFAIFDAAVEAETARAIISSHHPDWWSIATTTLAS